MKKRYAVFAFEFYYPEGGWDDYLGNYETIDEAKASVKNEYKCKCQIIDLKSLKIIMIGHPYLPFNRENYWKWEKPQNIINK